MSCRHDLALGTCARCYPALGLIDPVPGPHAPNLDGPGASPPRHDEEVTALRAEVARLREAVEACVVPMEALRIVDAAVLGPAMIEALDHARKLALAALAPGGKDGT